MENNITINASQSSQTIRNYVTVVGIAMQGIYSLKTFKNTFVTQFQVLFSNDTVKWMYEEEPVGRQKVYKCMQCDSNSFDRNDIVMYNLLKPIVTRYVRVKIINYKIYPCLRLEIFGCRDSSEFSITKLWQLC